MLYVLDKAIAYSRSTGQMLLIGKLGITKAFDATDLQRTHSAAGDFLGGDIVERLVRESWRRRLR